MGSMSVGDDAYLAEWSRAWSSEPLEPLLSFYSETARYTDVGSQLTFEGHEGIRTFYGYMLKFAPDSEIRFDSASVQEGRMAAHWTWSGTAAGPLQVGDELFDATGSGFSVPGVAWCTVGADGLIATHDDYYDMHAVIAQL